jgi:orotidine-5'-phosphate decarboxylase
VALFDRLGADAVTASPYVGSEGIAPLLERGDRFAYVLCRTSNPGAGELQDLGVAADSGRGWPAEPLHARVARLARTWNERYGTVGLVVGATAPSELALLREIAPELALLVPGVGAQGGDAEATLRYGPATAGAAAGHSGGGLLVNVSRGIAGAARGAADPEDAVRRAAAGWAAALPVLQSQPGSP